MDISFVPTSIYRSLPESIPNEAGLKSRLNNLDTASSAFIPNKSISLSVLDESLLSLATEDILASCHLKAANCSQEDISDFFSRIGIIFVSLFGCMGFH